MNDWTICVFLSIYLFVLLIFHPRLTWKAYQNKSSASVLTLETSISVYDKIPVVVFDIVYIDGLTKAADPASGEGTLSTFPSFVVEAEKSMDRGWMTWSGNSEWKISTIVRRHFFHQNLSYYGGIDLNI